MKKLVLIFTGGLFMIQAKSQNLKQAISFTENELFETSGKAFYQLISSKPNDAELYFYMGENFFASERPDSASAYYNKGVEINPSFALNYVGKGRIALNKGNDAEAEGFFAKAKELAPKDAQVYIKIADAYVENGQQKNMKSTFEVLEVAKKLDSKNPKVYLLLGDAQLLLDNDGSKAIGFYDEAATLSPNSPMANVHTGALYEKARAYDLAFAEYNSAIQKDSTYAPSYRKLGDLYFKYNDYKNAELNYEKYLRLAGNSFSAKVKYAKFLFLAKKYDKTITTIKEIQTVDNSLNILNRLLAYSYYETKQYPDGLVYIEKFLADAEAGQNQLLAQDFSYYGKLLSVANDDSVAIIQFKKALEIDENLLDAYTDLANAYKKMGKFNEAIESQATKIEKSKEPGINDLFALGQLYYGKGGVVTDSLDKSSSFVSADSIFTIITERMPTQVVGYVFRARANAGLDPKTNEGLAKPYYEKVVELGAADVARNKSYLIEANYYLAYFYFNTKVKADAIKYTEDVLAIDPAHEQSKNLKELITKYLKD